MTEFKPGDRVCMAGRPTPVGTVVHTVTKPTGAKKPNEPKTFVEVHVRWEPGGPVERLPDVGLDQA
jgi:hypothetical protein